MEIEKVFKLIIVAIAVIYTAAMFYFFMNLGERDLTKKQTHQRYDSKANIESESVPNIAKEPIVV
ncbi:hypothetical protein ACA348_02635 [Orientia tsutsugamushi]|uniref:hypothetical protein n=1 Tax=Orientia tsutsugamushi TaxID=784 RepID=UPI003527059F